MAFNNFDPIQAGDACVVVFDGTTPDLVGDFQRFISDSGTAVITTPAGEKDPALQTTHYIDDYQYIGAGVAPAQINEEIQVQAGDNVTIYFGAYNVPGATDEIWTITGVVQRITSGGVIQLDAGGTITVVKDYWYLEIN